MIWIDRLFILALFIGAFGNLAGAPVWKQFLVAGIFYVLWQGAVWWDQGKLKINIRFRG